MRKTNWACLLLGMVLGIGSGFSLVILQLKYGQGPVVTQEAACCGEQPSCLEEPKPLDDDPLDAATDLGQSLEEPTATQPAPCTVLMPPVPVPLGPVEVTVHRTEGIQEPDQPRDASLWQSLPGEAESAEDRLDQVQRRMFHHLLKHAQASAQQEQGSENGLAEPVAAAPVPGSSPDQAELLPAPRVEEGQATQPVAAVPAPGSPDDWRQSWGKPVPPPLAAMMPPPPGMGMPMLPPPSFGPQPQLVPFTGTYRCTLTEQGELTLPAQVHETMDCPRPRALFVGPGEEKCVCVYTLAALQRTMCEFAGFPDDARARKQIRQACSRVQEVDVTADGRLKLSAELIERMGLKTNVVVIGVRDHYEIWDAATWQDYLKEDEMPAAADTPVAPLGQAGETETDIVCEEGDLDCP